MEYAKRLNEFVDESLQLLGSRLAYFEFGSWEMIDFARVSNIIVQTLSQSTKTFFAVFPNTTGRLIDSIGVGESAEDNDATQLSSSDD